MRRLLTLLATTAIATLAWLGLARFAIPPTDDVHWIAELYAAKTAAARAADNKLLLVGGSSGFYGWSAEDLSRRLGVPVVNFATHAGLGGAYLLYRAAEVMQSGDTIVLAIEPTLFADAPPSNIVARYVQFYDASYLTSVDFSGLPTLLFGTAPHDSLRAAIKAGLQGFSPSGVNRFGNSTTNLASAVTPEIKRLVESTPPVHAGGAADRVPKYLSRFVALAEARGVKLIGAWAPMLDHPAFHDPADPQNLLGTKAVYQRLGVETLGDPRDFLFPIEDMFNTSFHLNDVGKTEATRRLGDLLCAAQFEC